MEYNYLFEVWRTVDGYEGLYEVSNFGRVRSCDRWLNNAIGTTRFYQSKILKVKVCKGYEMVNLSDGGKVKTVTVHRIVAQAFIPNPQNFPCINHKDENKLNNFVWVNPDGTVDPEKSNLEWCTIKYNVNYGTGLKKSLKNRKGKTAEKPVLQFTKEGEFIERYDSVMEAERKTGVGNWQIRDVLKGKHKTTGGYIWKSV